MVSSFIRLPYISEDRPELLVLISFRYIFSPEIRKAWENRKTITANLNEIGLGYDPNKVIKVPNNKQDRLKMVKLVNGFVEEEDGKKQAAEEVARPKGYVMEKLEEDANALRESGFRYDILTRFSCNDY